MNIWDIRPLFTLDFWFNVNPPPLLPFFEQAFFFAYCIILIAAIIVGFMERKAKGTRRVLLEKVRRCATTLSITGLLLSFFSYERTTVLSMHALSLLLWLLIGVWIFFILRWHFRIAPRFQKTAAEREAFEKYLPK